MSIPRGRAVDGPDLDVIYKGQLDTEDIAPDELAEYCEEAGLKTYSYDFESVETAVVSE